MSGTPSIWLTRSALALGLMSAAASPVWAGSICDRNNSNGGLDTATGLNAFACGGDNRASGDESTAVGFGNRALGNRSNAFGRASVADQTGALAIGSWFDRDNDGTIDYDTFVNLASGSSETAVATGAGAVAVGAGVMARGSRASAFGTDSAALYQGSSAIGSGSTAAGFQALAIGTSSGFSSTNDDGSLNSVGTRRFAYDANGILISIDDIAVTATGSGMETITHINGGQIDAYRRDAFAKGIVAGGALALGDYSIAQGLSATALDTDSIAIGSGAVAMGRSSTALGENSRTNGDYATALGGGFAVGEYSTALGQSYAIGKNNLAVGTANFALGDNNTMMGSGNQVAYEYLRDENGDFVLDPETGLPAFVGGASNIIAIGANDFTAQESSTVGFGADNAIAIGRMVTIGDGAADGIAIGRQTQVTAAGAVALGAGSIADRANTVSVGSAGNERQITNVADGVAPTDAVNRRQLDAQLSGWSRDIDQRIGAQGQRINTVGALSAALSMATPDARVSGANQFSMGVGHYQDQQALSVGYSRLVSPRTSLRVAAAFADGENAAGVGFNVGW